MRLHLEHLENRDVPSTGPLLTDDVWIAHTPNDPRYDEQWDMMGGFGTRANDAWDITKGRKRVKLANIDTGVDYDRSELYLNIWINNGEIPGHIRPKLADVDGDSTITFYDLANPVNQGPGLVHDTNGDGRISGTDILNLWSNGSDFDGNGYVDDLVGWDFRNNDNRPKDDNGHGTHTAGTMAAKGDNGIGIAGINFRVRVMVLKFLSSSGSGSTADGAEAIRYAADMKARASNNSWGGGFSQAISDAVTYANGKGHLVICAAGNSNNNNDSNPFYPASLTQSNIISVAATNANGNKASFSNYGATSVDLGAPGVGILSVLPGEGNYGYLNGTSMAAPHVTGAVGLLVAIDGSLKAAEIKSLLLSTTTNSNIGPQVVADGVLNIAAALDAAQGSDQSADAPRDLAYLLISDERRGD